MEGLKDLWPIIQSGGAALTVGAVFAIRYLIGQLDTERKKNDALTAKFIELTTAAALAIDRNTAQTATNTELLKRYSDRA